jgi:hypothetical protein
MRPAQTLAALLLTTACSARPVADGDDTGTAGTNDETTVGDGDTTESTGDGDPEDPCGCDDDQWCVADCQWGDFQPNQIINPRCIDAALCIEHGSDSPPCLEVACGSLDATATQNCATPEQSFGYDIICGGLLESACDEVVQDCPEGEKCVARLDRFGVLPTRCVPVVGSDPIDAPCSSTGHDPAAAGTDSCDEAGMCFNGMLSAEPFEGTCYPFCSAFDDPQCPPSTACSPVDDEFMLCVPVP